MSIDKQGLRSTNVVSPVGLIDVPCDKDVRCKATTQSHVRLCRMAAWLFGLAFMTLALRTTWAADVDDAAVEASSRSTLQFDNVSQEHGFTLSGLDARLQLVVSRQTTGQLMRDMTHEVQFRIDQPEVVQVLDGMVIPLQDGSATITAVGEDGLTADLQVKVENTGNAPAISFPGRVVPIFTKLGCNGGGCHGKLAGQNGFKLSLLGFEPREDYEHLVRESRGRRLSPASPEQSLLLQKSILPHICEHIGRRSGFF